MSSFSSKRASRAILSIEGDMVVELDEDENKPGFPNPGLHQYHFFPNPALGFSENSAESYTVNHVAESWGAAIDPDRGGGMYVADRGGGNFDAKRNVAAVVCGLYISQDAFMVDPGQADDDFTSLWDTEVKFFSASFDAVAGHLAVGDAVEWNGVGGGNDGFVYEIKYLTATTGTIKIKAHPPLVVAPLDNDVIAKDVSNSVTLSTNGAVGGNMADFYWYHIQYGSGTYAMGTQKASRPGLWMKSDVDITPLVKKLADSGYAMVNFIYRQIRADDWDPDIHLKNS